MLLMKHCSTLDNEIIIIVQEGRGVIVAIEVLFVCANTASHTCACKGQSRHALSQGDEVIQSRHESCPMQNGHHIPGGKLPFFTLAKIRRLQFL